MADTDTMKFGPQWLRQLSDGGGNVYSPPPTPVANLGHFGKFKMADHRYGKEEILALYQPRKDPPECLKRFSEILSEDGPQNPVSVGPLSEEEQRLLMHGVNSNQVYRMMSSTHRGANSQNEGATGDSSGVGRGGGGGGSGGGPSSGAGRAGRGRGARRAGEVSGEVGGGEPEAGGFSRGPAAPGSRNRGGRGGVGPNESANMGRGGYRGRGDSAQTSGEGGDSNGDWRRVSRQRFPSESDTDWRRGPRAGAKEGAQQQQQQQRGSNTGGAGGGRVGGTSRTGGTSKANDSSGSWRQRPNSTSDQRHFGAAPGGGSGRGRGMGREKGGPRPDSEEEIPEWVNDENGRDDSGTGFFDSSGAYKPTVGRGPQRSHRARQASTGSSGGGSFTRNNDSEDYWEDDWETEFELYDGLDGSARSEPAKDRHSSVSNEEPEEEAEEKGPGKAVVQEPPLSVPPEPPVSLQPKETPAPAPKEAAVRPSVLAGPPRAADSGGPPAELALTDPSIKAIIPTPSTPVELSVAASLQAAHMRWFYRDPQGRTQGPFTASQMQEWFQAGFFDLSLAVRRACDANFSPLESYFKAFGSQTFVGALPPNALSPVSPDPNALHLMLQQRQQLALLLKQQQQQQQQQSQQQQAQPQSPEKMAAGLVSPSPEMILLNMMVLQQQLLASGMPVPDALADQIEALKRQQPSFVLPKIDPKLASPAGNEAAHFPTAARTNASPVDTVAAAAVSMQASTPSSQWPITSVPSIPSTNSDAAALWQQLLEPQMTALREEMERDREEAARQQEQQKRAKLAAEEAELERRRQEVEERERRLQKEEADRQALARRQEEERAELDRRRLEMEELEKQRLAELRRLEDEAEAAAAAAAAAEAEAALRRQVEAEREAAERRRQEEAEREMVERRRRQQEEREMADRRRRQQQQEEQEAAERRRRQQQEESEVAERRRRQQQQQQQQEQAEAAEKRRRQQQEEAEAAEKRRRQQEEAEAAERRRRQQQEEAEAAERRRRQQQQEEEARRSQLNKFQLPESARWGSAGDGVAAPGVNLMEIQRLQQQKEEEEAQEARAMRLEREAAKLSAQRQAQLGPWNVGGGSGGGGGPVVGIAPTLAVTPTGRQKSFMEIQAEEQAKEELGGKGGVQMAAKAGPVAPSTGGGSNASIWGASNWSSKVQQPPSPSAQAANRSLAAAASVGKTAMPVGQPAKGRSVWNYGGGAGGASGAAAKSVESKTFPSLGSGGMSEGQQKKAAGSQGKKKSASSREEERVSKLFSQTADRGNDDELTRWCKAAIDRVACPTTLDKSMFVEYLISMETAADIEEMMGAYHYDPGQTKKFVAEFLEKRRQFRKAVAEGTEIVLPFTDNFSKTKEDEFQKVGSSNKAGGSKRNRKKKAQKVSNLLNIKSTGDPDRVNVGEIEFAD